MQQNFTIRLEPSVTLNYLVYLQNLFLNSQVEREKDSRFPLFAENPLFLGTDAFKSTFEQLWTEASTIISEHPMNDKRFFKEKSGKFESLFEASEQGNEYARKTLLSFEVWWNSFSGEFSIERSINGTLNKVYRLVSEACDLEGIDNSRQINVSLIYDECLLGGQEIQPDFVVLSIRDFYHDRDGVVSKLMKCIQMG